MLLLFIVSHFPSERREMRWGGMRSEWVEIILLNNCSKYYRLLRLENVFSFHFPSSPFHPPPCVYFIISSSSLGEIQDWILFLLTLLLLRENWILRRIARVREKITSANIDLSDRGRDMWEIENCIWEREKLYEFYLPILKWWYRLGWLDFCWTFQTFFLKFRFFDKFL